MKIFLITHAKWGYDSYSGDAKWGYDSYSGHVIVANNENEVRQLAKKGSGCEGDAIWDVATVTTEGKYTGNKTEPFKLLSDYQAG